MREMKDSGIEWIGAIPAAWGVHRIASHFQEVEEKNTANEYSNALQFKMGRIIAKPQKWDEEEINEIYAAYTVVHPNTIMINGLNLEFDFVTQRVAQVECDGIITSAYIALRPIRRLNSGFFRYLLHAYDISKVFYNMGNGVRQGLNFSEFSRLTVFEPPIEIQDKVTQYLDTATAEVDKIISDIQTQIDTLEQYKRSVITETVTKGLNPDAEMKDSGIQWIGDMPAHWGVIRGKYILRYMQKPVRENDGVITCFRDGEVTLRSNRREDGFTMSDKEIGYQGIDVDDLVIHGMDGFAGAIGISDSRGKASPVLNVLDTDQCKRYIMYYLRSMAYSDVFLALATGIRVRSCDLRWNKLAELSYPVPPLDEQNAIVKHIDSVLSKADAVIADKKAQLATLDEYKKSLIFEYVTGKKEVPVS